MRAGRSPEAVAQGVTPLRSRRSLTQIILTSNLPQIVKDGVTINGAVSAGNIIINANAVVEYGFRVNANQVTLTNLTVINTSGVGNLIRLENNLWMGLQIYNNYLGVLPWLTSCSIAAGITSRPYFTILILGGTGMAGTGLGTAYIDNNVIGCSQNDGIANQDAPYVYIGRNVAGGSAGNWIGVSRAGANIGNNGRGISVCCISTTTGLQIFGNHVAYNALDGIHLYWASGATVNNNHTFNNTGAGIHLLNASFVSFTNNTSHGNGSSGIFLDHITPIPSRTMIIRFRRRLLPKRGCRDQRKHGFRREYLVADQHLRQPRLGIDKDDNGVPGATGGIVITSIVKSGGGHRQWPIQWKRPPRFKISR